MTDYTPQQIVARGARLDAETAADAIDNHPGLEGATYSILEEDEDKNIWRIDAFPTISNMIKEQGWTDIGMSKEKCGEAAGAPTCHNNEHARETRIDYIFTNYYFG